MNKIASDRAYKNRDTIEISPELLPGYEEKVKNFFHEHLHEDEEIRYILKGGGYFDVRGKEDDWIRIRLEEGDLVCSSYTTPTVELDREDGNTN